MALACLAWAFVAILQVFLYWAVAPPGGSEFFFRIFKIRLGDPQIAPFGDFCSIQNFPGDAQYAQLRKGGVATLSCCQCLHPCHSHGGKEAWRDRLEPATPVSQVAGAWRESGSWAAVPQVLQSAGGPVTELKTGMRCAVRLTRPAAAAKMMSLGCGCT